MPACLKYTWFVFVLFFFKFISLNIAEFTAVLLLLLLVLLLVLLLLL